MIELILRWTVAVVAVVAVGWAAVRPRGARAAFRALPLAFAVGLALLTAASFAFTWLGGRLGAVSILSLSASLVGGLIAAARRWRWREEAAAARAPSRRAWWWLPAALALAVFTWKIALVPLWSWDHYAIWGVKAKKTFSSGTLDATWLDGPRAPARPDYPLGLPTAWRVLSLGAEPGEADFRLAHVLFAWSLVALVGAAAAGASRSPLAGGAAAALTAASPLLWDTESAGLADLPLALYAVAAVGPLVGSRAPATARFWLAGVCAGFLPWIKSEGLPLSVWIALLATAVCLRSAGGWRPLVSFLVPAALLAAAGVASIPGLSDREAGFFRGAWLARGVENLDQLPRLLTRLAADLVEPAWLGGWLLFLAALLVAGWTARRTDERTSRMALGLAAVVLLQLAVYAATYLVSYIVWERHVDTSFYRVAAALLPLALVSAAAAAGSLAGRGALAGGKDLDAPRI